MSVEPVIRTATEADIDAMLGLLRQLFSIEADFDFDADKAAKGLGLLLNQTSSARVMVVELGTEVVAMASLQLLISTAEGGRVALLEDLVVDHAHRGQGLGRRLLSTMQQWCDEQGLRRMQLLADRNNAPALAFYQAQGWLPTALMALRRQPLT